MHPHEVALVTGGSKGIGKEIVRRLAARGLTVYLGARDPEGCGTAGPGIRPIRLDVTDETSVAAAIETIEAETTRLDVLVNNAGITSEWGLRTADFTAAHLREVYEVNVFGVVTMISACLPLLRRSPNPRVVNLSSGLASLTLLSDPEISLPTEGFLAYSSSKAALNALTLLYAETLRADGIKVNAVSPGMVPTDQNAGAPFPRGHRTVAEGAAVPVLLATIPADGPSGVFRGPDSLDDVIPW